MPDKKTRNFSGARAVFKIEGKALGEGKIISMGGDPLHNSAGKSSVFDVFLNGQKQVMVGARLDKIGQHLGILRQPGESDDEFRVRVLAATPAPFPHKKGVFNSEFKYMSDSHFSESVSDPQTGPRSEVISRAPTHDWWGTTPEPVPESVPVPPASYRNPQGGQVTCPWCDSGKVEAEFVDVGVGHEQVSGHVCFTCGAYEIYPQTKKEEVSETEWRLGWHGPNEQFMPPENCKSPGCMETHICDVCKLKLWGQTR